MNGLQEQADKAKARELFWKPLSWLGTIRPTSANDAFDPALWETFVSTTLGLELTQVQPRPTTGWCPYWGRCSARPDTRYALNMA